MKTVVIIQARLGSSRLPGKVLLDLAGEPMLAHAVARCRRARAIDEVVVATPAGPANQPLADLCASRGWPLFQGSEDDVLDRYHGAAVAAGADTVVRVTSDCPLIEPEVIDLIVEAFREKGVDYASNTIGPRTFPRGLDVEVMSFHALERAWREDANPAWREHVTPFIYRNPNQFTLHAVVNEIDLSHLRWTVDTPEDMALIQRIYSHFGHNRFSWREVLRLCEQHPEWLAINQEVQQKEAP